MPERSPNSQRVVPRPLGPRCPAEDHIRPDSQTDRPWGRARIDGHVRRRGPDVSRQFERDSADRAVTAPDSLDDADPSAVAREDRGTRQAVFGELRFSAREDTGGAACRVEVQGDDVEPRLSAPRPVVSQDGPALGGHAECRAAIGRLRASRRDVDQGPGGLDRSSIVAQAEPPDLGEGRAELALRQTGLPEADEEQVGESGVGGPIRLGEVNPLPARDGAVPRECTESPRWISFRTDAGPVRLEVVLIENTVTPREQDPGPRRGMPARGADGDDVRLEVLQDVPAGERESGQAVRFAGRLAPEVPRPSADDLGAPLSSRHGEQLAYSISSSSGVASSIAGPPSRSTQTEPRRQ